MNARTLFAGMITSGAILGIGVGLGTAAQHSAVVSTPVGGATGAGTTSGTGTPASATDGTFTGSRMSTPFGDVQVQITVSGGKLTDVTALHLTDRGGRSVEISNQAAPILQQEVLSAQSANVQMVSGATYTSEGYLSSLQSALDQAGL